MNAPSPPSVKSNHLKSAEDLADVLLRIFGGKVKLQAQGAGRNYAAFQRETNVLGHGNHFE